MWQPHMCSKPKQKNLWINRRMDINSCSPLMQLMYADFLSKITYPKSIFGWQFHLLLTTSNLFHQGDASRSSLGMRPASFYPLWFLVWSSRCVSLCSSAEPHSRFWDGRRRQPLKCSGLNPQHTDGQRGWELRGRGADRCFPPCVPPVGFKVDLGFLAGIWLLHLCWHNADKSIASVIKYNFVMHPTLNIKYLATLRHPIISFEGTFASFILTIHDSTTSSV